MPWDWPVEVNYHEARAFLNWKGANDGKVYRMPTVRGVGDAVPWVMVPHLALAGLGVLSFRVPRIRTWRTCVVLVYAFHRVWLLLLLWWW
jgi:hypothetical protein